MQLLGNIEHNTYLYCEGDDRALTNTTVIFEQVGFRAIARGDVATVNHHLGELFKISDQLRLTYTDLGRHALSLAIQGDKLDSATITALKQGLAKDQE